MNAKASGPRWGRRRPTRAYKPDSEALRAMTMLLGSMGSGLGRMAGCSALANYPSSSECYQNPFASGQRPAHVGRRIFSIGCVPIVTAFFAKWLIVEHRNDGERGISHASLYSLRDYHFDCDRSRRLLGTPRKSRGRRAVEARLDDDGIALLNLSLRQIASPRSGSSRPGLLCVPLPPGAS